MSEKFDGVRGVWNGESLSTRNAKPLNPPKFWLENFPPFVLDGELWIKEGFIETLKVVIDSNAKEQWRNVSY